jgi:hypothetical protein
MVCENLLIGNVSVLSKLHVTPTKLELLKAKKACDIISPSSQGLAGDIIE